MIARICVDRQPILENKNNIKSVTCDWGFGEWALVENVHNFSFTKGDDFRFWEQNLEK